MHSGGSNIRRVTKHKMWTIEFRVVFHFHTLGKQAGLTTGEDHASAKLNLTSEGLSCSCVYVGMFSFMNDWPSGTGSLSTSKFYPMQSSHLSQLSCEPESHLSQLSCEPQAGLIDTGNRHESNDLFPE